MRAVAHNTASHQRVIPERLTGRPTTHSNRLPNQVDMQKNKSSFTENCPKPLLTPTAQQCSPRKRLRATTRHNPHSTLSFLLSPFSSLRRSRPSVIQSIARPKNAPPKLHPAQTSPRAHLDPLSTPPPPHLNPAPSPIPPPAQPASTSRKPHLQLTPGSALSRLAPPQRTKTPRSRLVC